MKIFKPMYFKYFVFFAVLFNLYACSTTKKAQTNHNVPTAQTNTPQTIETPPPSLTSNIVINYKVNKKSIVDTFNFVFDDFAKLPINFADQNTVVKLKRAGNSKIEIEGKEIMTTMAIDLDVVTKTFLKDFKANGRLEMGFLTKFELDKNWTLSTKTELVSHQWLKKPAIDLGVVNLPIETISNYIIDKSRKDMALGIDQSIRESFNMKAIISEINTMMTAPYQLDQVFGGWMQMTADSVFFTPAVNGPQYTSGKILLKTKMNVSSSNTTIKNPKLPSFSWKNGIADSSQINIPMELEYQYLTQILQENFVGKTFEEGDKKIEVLDAKVDKRDAKLQISLKTKGSFNGDIAILGIPAFDTKNEILYLNDIDVKIKTGNVLYTAAAWLLKGKIKSELDKTTRFSIKENMANIQAQVDNQVLQINKQYKIDMKVKLGSLKLNQVILRPDRMNVNTGLNFKLETNLENLALFRD